MQGRYQGPHSIKALHGFGKAETQDRYLLWAPNKTLDLLLKGVILDLKLICARSSVG